MSRTESMTANFWALCLGATPASRTSTVLQRSSKQSQWELVVPTAWIYFSHVWFGDVCLMGFPFKYLYTPTDLLMKWEWVHGLAIYAVQVTSGNKIIMWRCVPACKCHVKFKHAVWWVWHVIWLAVLCVCYSTVKRFGWQYRATLMLPPSGIARDVRIK